MGTVGNAPQKRVTEASRIPMSVPQAQLAVPPLDGYHLHWFLEKNVARALRAGYEFVDPEEVDVVNKSVADDAATSGSSDMGSRISRIGSIGDNNVAELLYLMKLKEEWYEKDKAALAERNESVARALRGGLIGAESDPDASKRYLKTGAGLFFPKSSKGA